ncbi:MAG TPA: gamma-glutamyltransferase, partial [Gaiellaceae bacterium]|nr:gamma-glutamyltransferase [Gaiellaceae bacterium]
WRRLVEPAARLARDGVPLPPAHARCLEMLEPVMTMDEGARIYAPGGRLLSDWDVLRQPGLVAALELVAEEGAASVYRGTLANELLALSDERDGVLERSDLERYEARWCDPVVVDFRGVRVHTRRDLSRVPDALERLPQLRGRGDVHRVLALVGVLEGSRGGGHTTNLSVVDARGNACVLTTSLGLGSGDFLPGLDLHLNSMLGETDLVQGALAAGERMQSMMAPSVATDDEGLALAIGSAGGTRLRTALVGVTAAILDEGLDARNAIERPRFHPVAGLVNAEPGVPEDALAELERRGWTVRRWPASHHYFGGVSAIARSGPAADPRRSGSAGSSS